MKTIRTSRTVIKAEDTGLVRISGDSEAALLAAEVRIREALGPEDQSDSVDSSGCGVQDTLEDWVWVDASDLEEKHCDVEASTVPSG